MGHEVFADNASRSETPVTESPVSPAVVDQQRSDNLLLRYLVERNAKEREVLITVIEDLQKKNKCESRAPASTS